MSLFARIKELLTADVPHRTAEGWRLPYGLTGEEWSALKTLPNREEWKAFLKALDGLAKLRGELMIQTSNESSLHFLRGFVAGVRKAGTVIEEIKAEEARHVTVQEQQNAAKRSDSDARSALYGTPGWRAKHHSRASGS